MTGEPLFGASLQSQDAYTAAAVPPAFPQQSSQAQSFKKSKPSKKREGLFKRRKRRLKAPSPEYKEISADYIEHADFGIGAPIPADTPEALTEAPNTWDEYQLQDEELDAWLARKHDSFTVTLFKMIDIRGLADADVYKRANMSRQLFSKIRSDVDYHPKKKTVLALAIALELNLSETKELLDCAGFSLSQSSQFDLIIEYFIRKSVYDCFAINEALFAFGEELLN